MAEKLEKSLLEKAANFNFLKRKNKWTRWAIDDLEMFADYHGHMPEEIDKLIDEGLTPDEIEEFLYCY